MVRLHVVQHRPVVLKMPLSHYSERVVHPLDPDVP